jgi:hypothetical protein
VRNKARKPLRPWLKARPQNQARGSTPDLIGPRAFESIRAIDDKIGAGALVFRLAPLDPEPAFTQACQRSASGMGKPAPPADAGAEGRAGKRSPRRSTGSDLIDAASTPGTVDPIGIDPLA